MLFLLLQLDGDRYALNTRDIAELLPLVACRPIPGAPACVAGIIDYGGEPVPVIDLSELLARRPARRRLSTRIVLAKTGGGAADQRLLGLIAEHATEAVRRDPADFRPSVVAAAAPPQFGGVAFDAGGPVHLIDLRTLLPEPVRQALASSAANAA
jgi:chemotaxis-related protein WspB